ncbi:MAG TPA: SPOR domain-containing protein [Persephonella sp.]|nr:SPOR domain-containing protein [Hydrogenothermaceae bacterium]HIQ25188.1 SPOR domain-containing protein [Persephonella sp.]
MKKILILPLFIIFMFFLPFYGCSIKQQIPKKEIEDTKKLAKFYYKLGLSYLNSGNIAQALYNLNKALELNPKDTKIYSALGIAYSKVNEFDKAKYYFLQALKIDPKKPEIYTNLGIVLAKKGQINQAIKNFKKAISFPNYERREIAYYNLALAYKKLGNLDKYEKFLNKAISYNNYFIPAYEALIDYYLELEKIDTAKNTILRAISNGVANAKLYFSLGKIYYLEKNYKLAKKYLKKAKLLADKDFILKQKINRLYNKILEREKQINKPITSFNEKKTKTIQGKTKTLNISNVKPKTVENKQINKKEKNIKKLIRFYIQLGIFPNKKDATKLLRKLGIYGHKAKIEERKIGKSVYYIVYIGYFKNYLEASRYYKKKLKPVGFKGTIKFTKIKVEDGKKQKG